jgi:hypothetical protein
LRPKIKKQYDSEAARKKIQRRRQSIISAKTGIDFRTRTTGTDKQIGQHFPILGSRADLPKPHYRKPLRRGINPLEKHALEEEAKLVEAFGGKGWMITVKYKDGSTEDIPVIAKNYEEAMKKAKPKMNQRAEQIQEIVIVDPSIGEILHKVGAGAARVARAIGRGAWRGVKALARAAKKAPGAVERAAIKAATAIGKVEALPEEMREAEEIGRARRPGIIPAEAGEPARRVLTPEEASMMVAEVMRGTPMTEKERKMIEAAPMLYRPREEPPPYTAEELRAAQQRIAERRAARATAPREREMARVRAAKRRKRVNGRSYRPFGVPIRTYQSAGEER